MLLPIRKEGDPILRKRCREVKRVTPALRSLAADMFETMYDANGAGLAAPQIGRDIRLVVIDAGKGPVALVNPRITASSGEQTDSEGCLSIPGVSGRVTRAKRVAVEALDLEERRLLFEAEDFFARAVQHELDHLDGILFTDKAVDVEREP